MLVKIGFETVSTSYVQVSPDGEYKVIDVLGMLNHAWWFEEFQQHNALGDFVLLIE